MLIDEGEILLGQLHAIVRPKLLDVAAGEALPGPEVADAIG